MALLLEISSFTGRGAPIRWSPQTRSRNNVRISMRSVRDSEMAVLDGLKAKQMAEEDYYLNPGYAIRTLRHEIPDLFTSDLSFDIYRDDIIFRDPMNALAGIENYKSMLWGLRFHGRIFFRALWVDIVSVWQPVEKNTIMARWIVHGIPRGPWKSRSRFDGTSEYKLDKYGKIYEHRVDNVAVNGPQKHQLLTVEQFIQLIGCPSTPKPTYFQSSSLSPITHI